ncbi:MAG: M48 family metallopeptidase [Pseudomonadaceae bacterium]|nr:M48 family metallopeptidase [Pseudomonadaceae bacterium]
MQLELSGRAVPLVIQRNKRRRRRVGISFDPDGHVRIDAPPRTSLREIEEIVRSHERWILRNIDKALVSGARMASSLTSGDLISVGGLQRMLVVSRAPDAVASVSYADDVVMLRTPTPDNPAVVTSMLCRWWQDRAQAQFAQLMSEYATVLPWLSGCEPTWRQRFMRSQWGSCSASGRISLNSHLAKLPDSLVRYVVLHELCHLVHLNHSRRYYALLERYLPNWTEHRRALDDYAAVLLEPVA